MLSTKTTFTEKESEVVKLLSTGLSSKQIAAEKNLSVHTVDSHRRNMLAKFDLKNTKELVILAEKHNIILRPLQLSLISKWFLMTKAGIKTEDYREITPYWIKRLCVAHPMSIIAGGDLADKHTGQQFSIKKFSYNIMTLGYPLSTDSDRILNLEHSGIEIRDGKPEWGAEPGKLYFVIKHGNIISQ